MAFGCDPHLVSLDRGIFSLVCASLILLRCPRALHATGPVMLRADKRTSGAVNEGATLRFELYSMVLGRLTPILACDTLVLSHY